MAVRPQLRTRLGIRSLGIPMVQHPLGDRRRCLAGRPRWGRRSVVQQLGDPLVLVRPVVASPVGCHAVRSGRRAQVDSTYMTG